MHRNEPDITYLLDNYTVKPVCNDLLSNEIH